MYIYKLQEKSQGGGKQSGKEKSVLLTIVALASSTTFLTDWVFDLLNSMI